MEIQTGKISVAQRINAIEAKVGDAGNRTGVGRFLLRAGVGGYAVSSSKVGGDQSLGTNSARRAEAEKKWKASIGLTKKSLVRSPGAGVGFQDVQMGSLAVDIMVCAALTAPKVALSKIKFACEVAKEKIINDVHAYS